MDTGHGLNGLYVCTYTGMRMEGERCVKMHRLLKMFKHSGGGGNIWV
jgi:hypothetical protein